MASIDLGSVLATTALLHWLNLVIPGANVLLIVRLAASGQRRAALLASHGMAAMVLVYAVAIATGLTRMLGVAGPLTQMLQLAGGAWFCFIALQLWRPDRRPTVSGAGPAAPSAVAGAPVAPAEARPQSGAFLLGLTTAAANPTAGLFYLTVFVTQSAGTPTATAYGLIVGVLVADTLIWYSGLALLLSRPGVSQVYQRYETLLCRLCSTGLALVGLQLMRRAIEPG